MKYLMLIFILCGCSIGHPGDPVKTTQPEYNVQYMFTVDSVKVYRFTDNGIKYMAIGKQGISIAP